MLSTFQQPFTMSNHYLKFHCKASTSGSSYHSSKNQMRYCLGHNWSQFKSLHWFLFICYFILMISLQHLMTITSCWLTGLLQFLSSPQPTVCSTTVTSFSHTWIHLPGSPTSWMNFRSQYTGKLSVWRFFKIWEARIFLGDVFNGPTTQLGQT